MNAPPNPAATWNSIAVDLAKRGFYPSALACMKRALAMDPGRAEMWSNYGNMLRRTGRMDEAFAALDHSIELKPDAFDSQYCMGVWHNDSNNHAMALRFYERALQLQPGNHDCSFATACAQLSLGRWKQGFAGYEVRNDDRTFGFQMWDGRPLGSKRLLLHGEQGLGDTIMFHRFKAMLPQEVKQRIDYVVAPPLAGALEGLRAGVVLPFQDTPRVHLPLMSLPRVLGVETIDAAPYIGKPAIRMGVGWPAGTKYKIGLVWRAKSGKADMKTDERLHGEAKSMPLELLLELTRIKGAQLYGLQNACDDIARLEAGHLITDMGGVIHDFTDLAALICEMDVIVSVDTAPAHLAGALGKPCIVCLHNSGAWHWGAGGHSAWYDSAQIVRQRTPGTWPINDIVAEVEKCLSIARSPS